MNNKMNHLHERCLRIVYSDKTDRSVPIHIRNPQVLAAEIFKISKDLGSTIFSESFSKRSVQYNLRHGSKSFVPNVKALFIVQNICII